MRRFAAAAGIWSTATAVLVGGCTLPTAGAGPTGVSPKPGATVTAPPATLRPTGTAGTARAIRSELSRAKVVAVRPEVLGYDRSCRKGHACSFGTAWKDVDRNGCDTRNDVLKAQLTAVEFKNAKRCVVVAGKLADPYTGRTIKFEKAHASKVQVDHVFALSRSWDLGASTWTAQRRTEFANDQAANLLAVDGATNASKGDKGPGEWMPVAAGYRCTWVLRYLKVANTYGLAITRDDQVAAQTITRTCP
ncbi:HNH endonuclease family protein [Kribbella solani]|uniref:GmrSD restriction endonucleases C-terminal domain-containing protein n=1 Tax=Kribbella solani TaxID=236067 RepID=A0A841E6M4_9ACTN|nr:HNH endonuclease family protein [Kribbella solani]MBB5983977.1 hypothetical protein [Kribbella solani]